MKIPALFRFLFGAFVATALSLSSSAQTASGQIKAVKVAGQVTKVSASGATTPLKDGDSLVETDAVVTGKGGSVVLVLSNGSSVKVGSDSRLAIDEFKMDPLAAEVKLSDLKEEPSVSQTKLNLAYGEMVGDVKKLNKSSSYSIKTPVGAAGIRGTIYRIVFRPGTDGKAFFTVSTAEGLVVMEGVSSVSVPIAEGKEVVVEVDTNSPSTPKVVTQDIPEASKAIITTESQSITQAVAATVIPPTPPPTPPTPPAPPPPPPADPTPPPPTLTPGA